MKLLIVVVLASCLLVKIAEGAAGDVGDACTGAGACTDTTKAECVNSKCTLKDGQTCDADDKCTSGKCLTGASRICLLSVGAACTANEACASNNCDTADTKKCLKAGASGVVASVCLMVAALVTSRFL